MAERPRNYPLWIAIGPIALFIRPLHALAALGPGTIMIGATYGPLGRTC